ncbi:MAG: hypothetical protein U1D30_19600 [Planctomycetota bacterium]
MDNPEPDIIRLNPDIETLDPYYSESHKRAVYTDYQIDIEHETNNHIITLPVAADPDEGETTASRR